MFGPIFGPFVGDVIGNIFGPISIRGSMFSPILLGPIVGAIFRSFLWILLLTLFMIYLVWAGPIYQV